MKYPRLLTTPPPAAAVAIESGRVTAITVDRPAGGLVVTRHAVEPLPPGAVTPGLAAQNIADRDAVAAALARAFQHLGARPRRVALALPDTVAKVSIVRFDKVPGRADDLDQLVRFQVRKAAPFRLEDAQVSYAPGAVLPDGGREFLVVVARRDIVAEYEAACAAAGAYAGLVDLATLNVVNMVLAAPGRPAGDWLLVHVTGDYATMAILRGSDLIFFRNRGEEDGQLVDLVHQTSMYYEDRLGGTGFARVLLAATDAADGGPPSGPLRHALEARLKLGVALLEPAAFARFADRITVEPDRLVTFAPLIGLLQRQAGEA